MGLTSALGTDWKGFLVDWCLNLQPGFTQEVAETALSALERLWPEHLDEFLAKTFILRGLHAYLYGGTDT